MRSKQKIRKVLAVASAGGHWVQLLRMRPAWNDCSIAYLTTAEGYKAEVIADAKQRHQETPRYYAVKDANLDRKFMLLFQLFQIFIILVKERPNIVISTGAAPGFFALKLAKIMGAKTIWVDSIANAETLSLSGEKIAGSADIWLTQWEHIAKSYENGKRSPGYKGSVI